jgi:hypothetical protein
MPRAKFQSNFRRASPASGQSRAIAKTKKTKNFFNVISPYMLNGWFNGRVVPSIFQKVNTLRYKNSPAFARPFLFVT